MKPVLIFTILFATSFAFANDRRCFELEYNLMQEKVMGKTQAEELPSNIRNRTQFKAHINDISGGALSYHGVCGLTFEEIMDAEDCYQDILNVLAGGNRLLVPKNTVTDYNFNLFLKQVSGGGVSVTDTKCEK